MNKPKIITIILIVVAIVVVGGYFYMQGSQTPSSSTSSVDGSLTSSQTTQGPAESDAILSLLNQVKSLNIDLSFFQKTSYTSLTDYSVAINSLPIGDRPNPFAALPGVPSPFATGISAPVVGSRASH